MPSPPHSPTHSPYLPLSLYLPLSPYLPPLSFPFSLSFLLSLFLPLLPSSFSFPPLSPFSPRMRSVWRIPVLLFSSLKLTNLLYHQDQIRSQWSVIHSLTHSSVRSFRHSFAHPFIQLFIHSFISFFFLGCFLYVFIYRSKYLFSALFSVFIQLHLKSAYKKQLFKTKHAKSIAIIASYSSLMCQRVCLPFIWTFRKNKHICFAVEKYNQTYRRPSNRSCHCRKWYLPPRTRLNNKFNKRRPRKCEEHPCFIVNYRIYMTISRCWYTARCNIDNITCICSLFPVSRLSLATYCC